MLKNMAWNTFKKTGNVDTFMELMQIRDIEKSLKADNNGNNKNERNYHIGK